MNCSTNSVVCVGCTANEFTTNNGKTYPYYRAVFVADGSPLELTVTAEIAGELQQALLEYNGVVVLNGLILDITQRPKLKVKVINIVR